MQIHGFYKTTLLDYPKHLAAAVFCGSCNFCCPFCQNASLVLKEKMEPAISEIEILDILYKRRHILEGVCITGGEPTLQPDLAVFISTIKSFGLKIKLDTNGNRPDVLRLLINQHLLDYIAMDIKNCKDKYSKTAGVENLDLTNIEESISLIINSGIEYEFRTTVTHELHTPEDIYNICLWIKGAKAYFLQCYRDSGNTVSSGLSAPSKEELIHMQQIAEPFVTTAGLRGID